MPLFLHEYLQDKSELGIWEITENEEFFLSKLVLYPEELTELAPIKGHRRVQWLAVRYLVHYMSGRTKRGLITKNSNSKPSLFESKFNISLSHCNNYATVFASPGLIGIDIEPMREKIISIRNKFINNFEENKLNVNDSVYLEKLHLIWGAKESIYKAWSKQNVLFKENIFIDIPRKITNRGITTAIFKRDNIIINFAVNYRIINKHFLVYAYET